MDCQILCNAVLPSMNNTPKGIFRGKHLSIHKRADQRRSKSRVSEPMCHRSSTVTDSGWPRARLPRAEEAAMFALRRARVYGNRASYQARWLYSCPDNARIIARPENSSSPSKPASRAVHSMCYFYCTATSALARASARSSFVLKVCISTTERSFSTSRSESLFPSIRVDEPN